MGLLDFLSSKPAPTTSAARPNALVVTPTSTQQGVLPTPAATSANYKDVQYPIPSNNDQLGATVPPEANGLVAKSSYASEPLPPLAGTIAPSNHVETLLDNGVRQVNHDADVNQPAIAPLPELTGQPQYAYTNTPVPAEALVEPEVPEQEVPEINQNPLPPVTETVQEIPQVVQTTVPEASTPTVENPLPVEEHKDSTTIGDIIEIGTPETTVEETPAPITEAAPTTEITSTPVIEEPAAPLQPDTNLEAAPVQEVTEIEKPIEERKSITVLNKIAFVSLNTQAVNSTLSKNIKTLAEMFKSEGFEIIIDSNKGYGMDVISGLSGTSSKVTAAYLKPMYSKYTDETTLDVPLTNLMSVSFSTLLSRIRFIYREANAFIIPETSGLSNLAQVTFLLNSQAMYPGSAKPVILFGTGWKNRINSLKDTFALTQQETDSMLYAATPEEAMDLLKSLDAKFAENKATGTQTMDLRSDSAEKEGLLSE